MTDLASHNAIAAEAKQEIEEEHLILMRNSAVYEAAYRAERKLEAVFAADRRSQVSHEIARDWARGAAKEALFREYIENMKTR